MRCVLSSSAATAALALCALLFALCAIPISTSASSMSPLSASLPPFLETPHPVQPGSMFGGRLASATNLPTNRWWQNLVLGKGEDPIAAHPYSLRMSSPGTQLLADWQKAQLPGGLELSQVGVYASLPQKEVSEIAVMLPWRPDVLLTTPASSQISGHQVVEEDPLSVRVQFSQQGGSGSIAFPVVRGAPYLTGVYSGVCPAIYTPHAILQINDESQPTAEASSSSGCTPASRFEVRTNQDNKFVIYLDREACANWDRNRIVFSEVEGGSCAGQEWVMRVAIVPKEEQEASIAILDQHSSAVPLSASVSFSRNGADPGPDRETSSTIQWEFEVADLSSQMVRGTNGQLSVQPRGGSGLKPSELLMLSLVHHRDLLTGAQTVPLNCYDGLKGRYSTVVGSTWTMVQPHANPGFYSTTAPLSAASEEWKAAVLAALKADVAKNVSTDVPDPYGFGKVMSKLGRLALIADELGESELASTLREQMKTAMAPWLAGSNRNRLLYDSTWGGLVSTDGLNDKGADFGQAYYNDHHFHYGYFVYAFACVAKEDPAWAQQHREVILAFVRDIANPSDADPHFTTFRHMDFFHSHSWANGLFAFASGRNSESSTEAINAYYGIALLGRALNDPELAYVGELLSSMELHGVRHYWHMSSTRSAYPAPFSSGKCVGMVWSDKAAQETWFAAGKLYTHGINILPLTPMTEWVLDREWVAEQYPVLLADLPKSNPAPTEAWMGFVHANLAVLDPDQAWQEMNSMSLWDNGATKTNMLWWVATRPRQ